MKQLHKNLYVAGQITPNEIQWLADNDFTVIINNRPDNEELGQLSHADAKTLAESLGLTYVFLPMANGQPLPENTVADFKKVVDSSSGKVLAHCRSGMRSSVIWALGAIAAGDVTIDQAVKQGQAAGIPLQNARQLLSAAT